MGYIGHDFPCSFFIFNPDQFICSSSSSMSDSREYSKRERKRRGVDLSAIEKLKQARSGQAKAIDNIKVLTNNPI